MSRKVKLFCKSKISDAKCDGFSIRHFWENDDFWAAFELFLRTFSDRRETKSWDVLGVETCHFACRDKICRRTRCAMLEVTISTPSGRKRSIVVGKLQTLVSFYLFCSQKPSLFCVRTRIPSYCPRIIRPADFVGYYCICGRSCSVDWAHKPAG